MTFRIHDLPSEIQSIISHHLEPSDIFNFYITSKHFQAITEDGLELHKDYKRGWEAINLNPVWHHDWLLKTILDDPYVVLYVRRLAWVDTDDAEDDEDEQGENSDGEDRDEEEKSRVAHVVDNHQLSERELEEHNQKLVKARDNVTFGHKVDKDWQKELCASDQDIIHSMLLPRLTRMESLTISRAGPETRRAITKILNSQDPVCAKQLFVMSLRHVIGLENLKSVFSFAALPSVRSIHAYKVKYTRGIRTSSKVLQPSSSHIESLTLESCSINKSGKRQLATIMASLRTFAYHFAPADYEGFDEWNDVLGEHCASSLVNLELRHLKNLTIDAVLLLERSDNEDSTEMHNYFFDHDQNRMVLERLPYTLQTITFGLRQLRGIEWLPIVIREFVAKNSTILPQLVSLTIERGHILG